MMGETQVQESIRQILLGMKVSKVISVDDFYAVADAEYSQAIVELFQKARSKRDAIYSSSIPQNILDAPENIWTRQLESFWGRAESVLKSTILSELATITGELPSSDPTDLSNLKNLIPDDMLVVQTPNQWKQNRDDILSNAREDQRVLCLFDQDLHSADLPDTAGITLLLQALKIGSKEGHVICGLLSQKFTKDAELSRAREIAKGEGLDLDQFLLLSKERLRDDNLVKFAEGLKIMVLNYARERLSKHITVIAQEADKQAREKVNNISVYDFEQIVLRSSEKEGVWEPDTLFRLFDLFRYNAFRGMALATDKRSSLYNDIERMHAIRSVEIPGLPLTTPSDQVHLIRQAELFDTAELLNPAYIPLDLGDIFEVGDGKYYILLAQPCDLTIHSRSSRIDIATLVKIKTNEVGEDDPDPVSNFLLSHFATQPDKKTFVQFRNSFQISLNVLDLAVYNDDGQCRMVLPDADVNKFVALHKPWRDRFKKLKQYFQTTQGQFQRIKYPNISDYQKKALQCSLLCSKQNIKFDYLPIGSFTFGVRRVKRYRAPLAGQLLSAYFSFLSRNYQEHDFSRND